VVKAIHSGLAENLQAGSADIQRAGKIVIGTVSGDVHDIGKNIVVTMLEVNGFEVHDLGVDTPIQEFIKRARELDADIIALSSLMTTSIPYMEDVIKLVNESEKDRDRFKILVGGGPVTAEVAEKMGADAFGEDAADAVRQVRQLLQAA
jgi:methylmalonyl-CoA mutase cobalamin-binding domain/chain